MRLFLNWIFQLYEILKQIIIILEGITVINFVYNNFIKQQKSEDIKNFSLRSDLDKEKKTTKELETTLTNVKSDLDKEKKTNNKERKMNDELRKDFLKIIEVNNDLQTKLTNIKKISSI